MNRGIPKIQTDPGETADLPGPAGPSAEESAAGKNRSFRTALFAAVGALLILFDWIPVPPVSSVFHYGTLILDEQGAPLQMFLSSGDEWCLSPDGRPVPDKLKKAVLLYEDRHFYHHPGINPVSVFRALVQNATSGKVESGASTITMQVARLLKPKKRTVQNKLLEMIQALKLEMVHSKDEILSLYLDHAPYGANIRGYRAASLRYFGKEASELTWSEAAILAVIPNAPGVYSPVGDPGLLRAKRDLLLKRLLREGVLDEPACRLAMDEAVPDRQHTLKAAAPQLCRILKKRYARKRAEIRTTVQRPLQETVQDLASQHASYLKSIGIRNAAVLVAETATGKIRAYVGSHDFEDENEGEVDGVTAPRSSGSLLKPFLYALAIDEGILLPHTLIKDIPSFYGSFSPANASNSYDGMVRAGDALIRSLNVPAVRLLYTYGVQPFYLFLKKAGVSSLFRSSDGYGLTLILGGAEVSLWDMAMMYRGLASGGVFEPLTVLETKAKRKSDPSQLISPGAAYLVLEILKALKRPGAEYYWEQYQNQWPLAWKTGTSYGYRDAWAVGVNPQWTIAVWTGNFTGEGNARLSGASCAGPLLFDIFNALPKDPESAWFEAPREALTPVLLCADTGYPAGPFCRQTVIVQAPRTMKSLPLCPYHRKVMMSEDGRYSVCSLCWKPGSYSAETILLYPPEVVQFLRDRGLHAGDMPPHDPSCPGHGEEGLIRILYPQEGSRLWIPREFNGTLQKVTCRAAHSSRDKTIYWYLDDVFLGSTERQHTTSISVGRGWHRLDAVDDMGYKDSVSFYAGLEDRAAAY